MVEEGGQGEDGVNRGKETHEPLPLLPGFCTLRSVTFKDGRAFSLGIAFTRLSFNAFSAN